VNSYLDMNTDEFNLSATLETVLTQGMHLSKERMIPLEHDWPPEVSCVNLYGDNLRLQQVLAEFLTCALQFTKQAEGPVVLRAITKNEQLGSAVQIVHLEFRSILLFFLFAKSGFERLQLNIRAHLYIMRQV
jgi:phytochrome B